MNRLFSLLCALALLGVFGTLAIAAGPVAGNSTEAGGLEMKSTIGEWVAKGMRGGGLTVTGDLRSALPMENELKGDSGSVTLLVRIDERTRKGGTIFAAGALELSQMEDKPYLQFSVGSKAVNKTNYDWKLGRWHHVTLSWSKGIPSIFINGVRGSAPYDLKAAPAAKDAVYLGGGPGKVTFDEIYPSENTVSADAAKRLAQLSLSGKMIKGVPTFSVGRTAKAPVIDGQLDDDEWANAASFTNLVHNNAANRLSHQAEVRMTYDDKNLYLGLRTPVIDSLGAKYTVRDTAVFADDSYEMFFMPNPSGELQYYQLVFNAIDNQFDGCITDAKWDGAWTSKSKVDKQWWTAEVVVPFKTVDALTPKDGFRWKFNICHSPSQWSQSGTYHNSSRFGILNFRDARPVVTIGEMTKVGNDISIPYRVIGKPTTDIVVKADIYPASGIRPVASDRVVLNATSALEGTLVLKGMNFIDGTVEITAFEDPTNPLVSQTIGLNADSFKPITFLKDLPGDKPIFRPKPVVDPNPVETPEPKPAVKPEDDPRPSIDDIEALIIEQQKWLGNSIGKINTVPKPWTPMKVKGNSVSCWAKNFDYTKGSGLPQQVTILDKSVLAKPMSIMTKTSTTGKGEVFIKGQADNEVSLVGRQQFGKVAVTTETTLEFDGFARVEMTLSPMEAGAELDGFALKLPIKKENAIYYSWWDTCSYGRPAWEVGNFIKGKMQSGFEASVWVGDEDRGFGWFAEAPRNWSNPDDTDLTEIIPGATSTDVIIHFLKGKQKLDKPVTFVFAYMATPAKERRAEWRTWEGKLGQIWGWETAFSAAHPPKNPESFRARASNPLIHPMLSVFFAGTHFVKDGKPTPEQWLWSTLWSTNWDGVRAPIQPMPNKNHGDEYVGYGAMSMSSTWPDYYLYKLKEMREKYGLRSVYLDTCIRPVTNPFFGMTWTDKEGKVRPKVDIFAFRETSKRIFNFIHEDPQATVMMHHSNQVVIPVLSFMDMHMNGEQFNTGPHQVGGRNYPDVLPVGTMRSCYTLKQWGVVPTFLPEHPESTRDLMGYFWAHDTTLYGAWVDHVAFGEATTAKQSFGMGDVDFLPYWRENAPAGPQPDGIYISAYRKQDKSAAMLVVANMQKQDNEVQVQLNEKNLGIVLKGKTVKGVDLEFGTEFDIVDGKLTLPVKAQDFRMIAIRK